MTDGSVVRRMFRQAGVAAVTCVTGLLTAGTSAALALELKQPSIDGYCMANGSGERNRYVVELGGHVNGQSNGDGTENVEEYRVRVTVRLRERFGGRWNKPAVRTLTSELQSTLDETQGGPPTQRSQRHGCAHAADLQRFGRRHRGSVSVPQRL
jgi:hypothetical protein